MNATTKMIFAGCVALLPALAMAQVNSTNRGYLVYGTDFDVVTAVGGTVCVRTSDWTPARAAAAEAGKFCDPDLAAKQAAPTAAASAPAPAPASKAPAAGPAVKPEAQKLLPQKINFSADAL